MGPAPAAGAGRALRLAQRRPAWTRTSPTTRPTTRSTASGITWPPGQLALHPGPSGEYSVVRWTAPADGAMRGGGHVHRASPSGRPPTSTSLHNGKPLFDGCINLDGAATRRSSEARRGQAGDTIDCVVGCGNGNYGADTTALAVDAQAGGGKTYDAAADFSTEKQPQRRLELRPVAAGRSARRGDASPSIRRRRGTAADGHRQLEQPRLGGWEDVLERPAPLPRVPHTAAIIHALRTIERRRPAGVPLRIRHRQRAWTWSRVVRHYEQLGKTDVEDAQFYRDRRDRFLADWKRWHMDEAFARPEDFFAAEPGQDGRPAAAGAQRHPLQPATSSATA